jgi:flagellar L-ring protein precursor FlgH
MRNSLVIILISIIFSACVSSKEELAFEKPEIQIPKKSPEPRKNKGSLYSVQGTSLFADKKDLQVGDIIQIIIDEDTSSKSNNKRELSSARDSNLG